MPVTVCGLQLQLFAGNDWDWEEEKPLQLEPFP